MPRDYTIQLNFPSAPTYINFAENPYYDYGYYLGNHYNFTNLSLDGTTSDMQSFGLGAKSGNVTLTGVNPASVAVSMQCGSVGVTCYSQYYYLAANPVYLVSAKGTMIKNTDFYSNYTAYQAAAAPAIYQNVTGSYLETKIVYSNPSAITYYLNIGNKTFIHADLNTQKRVTSVQIYEPDAATIPASVNVYASTTLDDWGSAVVSNHALAQQTGFQSISIPDTKAQYVKLEVNGMGSASTWKVSDMQVNVVDENTATGFATSGIVINNMWSVFQIMSFAMIIGGLGIFFYERRG